MPVQRRLCRHDACVYQTMMRTGRKLARQVVRCTTSWSAIFEQEQLYQKLV